MKKVMIVLFAMMSLNTYADGVGNGGGGIKRYGKYLTFGSAKIELKKSALEMNDIPGLKFLLDTVEKMDLTVSAKGELKEAFYPISDRKYFNLPPEELSPEKRTELLKEYKKILKDDIPLESLVIYAITVGAETYILPEFYELTDDIQRGAILFHEGLWVLNPDLKYEFVVDAEMIFEEYVRKNMSDYDTDLYAVLRQVLKDPSFGIVAAAKYEKAKGFCPLTLEEVFGRKVIEIWKANRPRTYAESLEKSAAFYTHRGLLSGHLLEMVEKNPDRPLWIELYHARKRLSLTLNEGLDFEILLRMKINWESVSYAKFHYEGLRPMFPYIPIHKNDRPSYLIFLSKSEWE